ncbi:MAG TPA: hypothetical protein VHA82_14275 [Ramlibacter sp.]|uniref:hypothetical protein n=1 Tax=Ramlibacter sp. TaxID=1917967 RepID=UPI002B5C36D7|nr:hypothetical protein [Ramlibacter sp.]HVZ44974.1 hypothetical protein [Ramlibacter sp.]
MQWLFTTIRSGLDILFSVRRSGRLAPEEEKMLTEDIRAAMLAMMEGGAGRPAAEPGRASPAGHHLAMQSRTGRTGVYAAGLATRIRFAPDVQGLWFLRSELMRYLASRHGEAIAREQLAALGEMFKDALPGALRSRPSPLAAADDKAFRETQP